MTEEFSTLPYLKQRWNTLGRKLAFDAKSPAGCAAWRRRTVRVLKDLTGYNTLQHAPLNPEPGETVDCGDYTRQRVVIQTEPGIRMPFYVLTPKMGGPRFPVALAPHGHGLGGKEAIAGRVDIPGVSDRIVESNCAYGVAMVKAGFITFCADARGMGERLEPRAGGDLFSWSCHILNRMAMPLGQTVTAMWAWDLHRLIDYVETRTGCDATRIACGGLSGGGLQALWATAFDTRIKCAVISGYFYGYKNALLEQAHNCSCNFVPNLWEHVDMGDIAALIAPRPVLIETGTRDPLNGSIGLANVTPQVEIARAAYRAMGVPERIKHDVFEGKHVWHGKEAIPWMQQWVDATRIGGEREAET